MCENERPKELAKTLESILPSSCLLDRPVAINSWLKWGPKLQTGCRLCHRKDWSRSNARVLTLELLQLAKVKTVHRPKPLILVAGMELEESTDNLFVSVQRATCTTPAGSYHNLRGIVHVRSSRRRTIGSRPNFLRMRNPKRALSVLKATFRP